MRPIKPTRCRSHRELAYRDQVMRAVKRKILSGRLTAAQIMQTYPGMRVAIRARILRDEWDEFSLTRAVLLADAVGVDLVSSILPEPPKPPKPEPVPQKKPQPSPAQRLAAVVERARAAEASRRRPHRSAMALGDLFEAA